LKEIRKRRRGIYEVLKRIIKEKIIWKEKERRYETDHDGAMRNIEKRREKRRMEHI